MNKQPRVLIADAMSADAESILAGRGINDSMAGWVGRRLHEVRGGKPGSVLVLGLTFKENVPDLRNSKIPDIISELSQYGVQALVHDPWGDAHEAYEEYKLELTPLERFTNLDALILAVAHDEYLKVTDDLISRINDHGVFIDVKSAVSPARMARGVRYWSL